MRRYRKLGEKAEERFPTQNMEAATKAHALDPNLFANDADTNAVNNNTKLQI